MIPSMLMKRRPEECYDLIENMTAYHNDWDTSAQRNESSSSITSSNPKIASLKLQKEEMNRNLTRMLQTNQQVNTVTPSCETCGGPHSYNDCPDHVAKIQKVYVCGSLTIQGGQHVANPKGELKAIATRRGLVLDEPSVPMPPPFINPEEDECVEETFTDPEHGSMQVLHGFEFKVEPLGDHTFEVEPQENVDQGAGLQEVQTQELMDYQLACDRVQHLACELFGYREDSFEVAFVVVGVDKIYAHESLTFNNTVACEMIFK
ncbi:hypothetical protein Tco_1429504 [Tanacetum coccineum]